MSSDANSAKGEQTYACTKCGWVGPGSECDYWPHRDLRWCPTQGCNYAVVEVK